MFRKLSLFSGLAAVASADMASKLDPVTFTKMMELNRLDGKSTMVVHFKKKYGHDSKDISDNLNLGSQTAKNVLVFDVEVAEEQEQEKSQYDEDHEEEAIAEKETPEERLASPREESDWKKKERKEKEIGAEMVGKFDIKRDELPYVAVMRGGRQVGSMKIAEDTEVSEVTRWLAGQGVTIKNDESSKVLPEFDEVLTKFAGAIKAKKTADFAEIIKEAEGLGADDMEDEETRATMAVYVKAMKSVSKQTDVAAYLEKESKRLGSMISSNAITATKKKEMMSKSSFLENISNRLSEDNEEL